MYFNYKIINERISKIWKLEPRQFWAAGFAWIPAALRLHPEPSREPREFLQLEDSEPRKRHGKPRPPIRVWNARPLPVAAVRPPLLPAATRYDGRPDAFWPLSDGPATAKGALLATGTARKTRKEPASARVQANHDEEAIRAQEENETE